MGSLWISDIKPVMMTDDIAFVGGTPVSVHVIIGRGGLILLDAGYDYMAEGIAAGMAALGLDIRDVKYILHTHGHVDHYSGTAQLVRMSGAKTLIGAEDVPIVSGRLNMSWAKELNLPRPEPFVPDFTFKDGDILRLCGRTIRCVHAPGHTPGTYAFFIETAVDGMPMTAAMHGGVGLNTLSRDALARYNLPLSLRDEFRKGLHALAEKRVDVVLGNHCQYNDTAGKVARMGSGHNPFVDTCEWPRFLSQCERELDDLIKSETHR